MNWLDVGMPGMSGYALARALRERLGGRQRLIYTLSGYGDEQTRHESRHCGCDGHFIKPLVPQLGVLATVSGKAGSWQTD